MTYSILRPVPRVAFALSLLLASLPFAPRARAICDVIPHSSHERQRGALGSVDRPFASPGEWVEMSASPVCNHPHPAAFVDGDGDGKLEDEYRVMLVFEPQGTTAPRRAVVLAEDCTGVDAALAAQSDCTHASVASARCLEINQANALPTLRTRSATNASTSTTELRLEVRLPRGTCSAGEPVVCYRNQDCASGATCDFAELERALTGPLTIAARHAGQTPPCELIPGTCAQARGKPGFGACIDAIHSGETSCGIDPVQDVDPTFPNFTALPPPNDFAKLCDDSGPYAPPCATDTTAKVRIAADARGNMLVPMWWDGVLDPNAPPLARLVRGSTAFPLAKNGNRPIRLPDGNPLAAYTAKGVRVPAFFRPQLGAASRQELQLFGLADARHSVIRIARRPRPRQGFRACDAASQEPGAACGNDAQCTGGSCEAQTRCLPSGTPACSSDENCSAGEQCGRAAFDLISRMKDGVGPVEIPRQGMTGRVCNGGPDDGKKCPPSGTCAGNAPCVDYRAQALWHAPLHYTDATRDLVVTVLSEIRLDEDLDGDGSKKSMVALVLDVPSFEPLPFGVGGAKGRAVATSAIAVGTESFEFPVVAAAGPVVALLEDCAPHPTPECDGSAGKEARLRVYRLHAGQLHEITSGAILPVPGDFIDGRRIGITPRGTVLYRAKESGTGRVMFHALEGRLNPVPPPVVICPASLASLDGERVAFLYPESEGGCGSNGSSQPVPLNADTDTTDTVVHQWTLLNGLRNLHCAATRVAIDGGWIAATVSEAQENDTPLNADGDTGDDVLHVRRANAPSASCQAGWKNSGQAADHIGVSDPAIAFLTQEASQAQDLNGDGDQDDRVIQVVFAAASAGPNDLVNLGMTADEFQLGERKPSACEEQHLLAFRTEIAGEAKLQIYKLHDRSFGAAVGRAVRNCDDMGCDPRRPYQVDGNVVRVLTDACQAEGGPSCAQIEVYDVCRQDPSMSLLTLAQPPASVSSHFFRTGRGSVQLGSGRCFEDLRQPCKLSTGEKALQATASHAGCTGAGVCRAVTRGSDEHSCFADLGWCRDAGDCPSSAECRPAFSLAYDGDEDGDAIPNSIDLCALDPNASQIDRDGDGFGTDCDRDDGDELVH